MSRVSDRDQDRKPDTADSRSALHAGAMVGLMIVTFSGCYRSDSCAAVNGKERAEARTAETSSANPLDPLSSTEINDVRKILMTSRGTSCGPCRIPVMMLREPDKYPTPNRYPDSLPHRYADVVAMNLANGGTFRGVVDITNRSVTGWHRVSQGQPPWSDAEYASVTSVLESDRRWAAALRRRGIYNLSRTLAVPLMASGEKASHRWVRVIAFLRSDASNPFAIPLEGLAGVVDLTANRLDRVIDVGPATIPHPLRTALPLSDSSSGPPKPLYACQPDVPSFSVSGHQVRWEGWQFRFGANAREGLVLYRVAREHGGVTRSILARASLSEMFVPYGSPDSTWYFRAAFDVGQYMLGRTINPLVPRVDAPVGARFFPVQLPEDDGTAREIARGVVLYERDAGVLWRHGGIVRGARELVLRSVYTVGNYDYGVNWIFGQDGSIRVDVELSGIIFAQGVSSSTDSGWAHQHGSVYGHLVDKNIVGIHHQHFFGFRLDFDIDGNHNSVLELNSRPQGRVPKNAHGNAFLTTATLLDRPASAVRDANPGSARSWIVVNPSAHNSLGQAEGYAIIPGETAVPYLDSAAPIARRAAFAYHQLWVTTYRPAELFAAGTFVDQGNASDRVAPWSMRQEPIAGADVVVWYTVGVTHVPRPEDWPVMPTLHAGFTLRPYGFGM